ncbi:hypothetical protein H0H87_007757 [Tephrocybe sp. NHM501043]|nr:hypothetical protein H0H87_007757 [Tephrocybe sp. NHM501043]
MVATAAAASGSAQITTTTPLPFGEVPKITENYVKVERQKRNTQKTSDTKQKLTDAKQKTTTIAAVFDYSSDDASDEASVEANDADHYADEYVLPNHIFWNANLSAPSVSPLRVKMLIDNGSPPALISSKLAKRLNIPF